MKNGYRITDAHAHVFPDKIAEKVLDEKKSLQGCFDKMKETAEKHMIRTGNVGTAYIPPEEGFSIIRDYYGIDLAEKSRPDPGVIDITDFL